MPAKTVISAAPAAADDNTLITPMAAAMVIGFIGTSLKLKFLIDGASEIAERVIRSIAQDLRRSS
jgi:hypothetical protein